MNEQNTNNTNTDKGVNSSEVTQMPTPEPVIETNLGQDSQVEKKAVIKNYIIATVIVVLMGGGLWLVLESQGRVATNFLSYFEDRGPVALVNGIEISREAYQTNRNQLEESAVGQGADISDPEVVEQINTQTIETLINTELLKQKAMELNIEASEEEVEARFNTIVEQVGGEEELTARMEELGLTEEGLRSDIVEEIIIQKLFVAEAGTDTIEVTDEEVEQVFAQVSAQGGDEITLDDETREMIVSNIRMSKEQSLVTEYIQSLRDNADVEVKI